MTKHRKFKHNNHLKTLKHKTSRNNWHKKRHSKVDFRLSQDERKRLEPFVKNLSKIQLSDIQISALAKGLKHIPTPGKPSRTDLVKDVDLLQRRMRIRYIMRNKKNYKMHKFKLPSTWVPRDSGSITLETYLEKTKENICHLRFSSPNSNCTKQERQALNQLSKNPDIVIKKMDKGRGVAIMDSHDYIQTGLKHLSSHHYELIAEDPSLETAATVRNLLEELNDLKHIDDDTFFFLNPFIHGIRTSEMYFLPKLHKAPPPNSPFEVRPICSGINSATYSISKLVDYFLAPIAASQPTYIRDSTDIILKLQNYTLPQDAFLVTIDVKAMYTNIDHDMAIKTASEAYNSNSKKTNYDIKPIPTKYLTKLLEIILKNNTFRFDGLHYKQSIGLAMGSPASCSIATIALHPLENLFLQTAQHVICFFRFLDDIIMLSSATRETIIKQIAHLNTLHPTLKFTADISDSSINFLDITIYKGPNFKNTGRLSTKIFTKPCDTFQYIMPTSIHPPSTFKAFIYGEFLRIIRNSSEKEEYEASSKLFKERLILRGYDEAFILNIQQSVSHENRQNILEETGNKPERNKLHIPLVFTTTYTGHISPKDTKKALLQYWHLIEHNPELNRVFKEPPLIAFKRSANIQDKVIKTKLEDDGTLDILLDLLNEQ